MNTFLLTISSPEGDILTEEVKCLSVRGIEGELAIMAGHIPFVTTVKPCECRITKADDTVIIGKTEGGILTVSNQKVSLLSGSFEWK